MNKLTLRIVAMRMEENFEKTVKKYCDSMSSMEIRIDRWKEL